MSDRGVWVPAKLHAVNLPGCDTVAGLTGRFDTTCLGYVKFVDLGICVLYVYIKGLDVLVSFFLVYCDILPHLSDCRTMALFDLQHHLEWVRSYREMFHTLLYTECCKRLARELHSIFRSDIVRCAGHNLLLVKDYFCYVFRSGFPGC